MNAEVGNYQMETIQLNAKVNDLSKKLELGKNEMIFEVKQEIIKSVHKTIQNANRAGMK